MQDRLLLFTSAGQRFALPLPEVAEVIEPIPPSYPVPRAPGHITGLINCHGSLTALLDLSRYLGRPGGRSGQGKLLVLDPHRGALALKVDEVHAVVGEAVVLSREPAEDPLCAELLETEAGPVRLLSVENLLGQLEQELETLPTGGAPAPAEFPRR